MVKGEKAQEAKEKKITLTKEALSFGEWLTQIAPMLTPENLPKGLSRRGFALSLLYTQKKVVDKFEVKGETIFIVEK